MKNRFALLVLTVMSAMAHAQEIPAVLKVVSVGGRNILADQTGRTAYIFDIDGATGVSQCYTGCAQEWPPILVDANAQVSAPFGITQRKDGTSQIMMNNKPLYLYVDDVNEGQTSGDTYSKVWHLIVMP